MSKVKSLKLILLVMIVLAVLFPFAAQSSTDKADTEKRPDYITIQLGAENSKEEMPAVGFSHDLHTQAVDGKCAACHFEEEGAFVFEFKRIDEPGTMELYHEACFACHTEKKAANEKAGPQEDQCRACHVEKPKISSSWTAIAFDRPLHYMHEKAKPIKGLDKTDQNNCSACHHLYNEKSKEIYFAKGKEESCTYCHKAQTQEDVRSLREASHDECVKCHQLLKSKDVDAGPVSCEGCHDAQKQKEIKKPADVPRLKRNQPDFVAITGWGEDSKETKGFMDSVAFDHKSHETATNSCKICHHQTLKKCNDCHKPDGGTEDGGFVTLGMAMHNGTSSQSCVGCHKETTRSTDCAGCHDMTPAAVKKDPASCKKCHALTAEELKNGDPKAIAEKAVTEQASAYKKLAVDKIPETVEIKILSNEYKPAVFPHRKVVEAIFARVEKSAMANAFHEDQSGLCMGCHHNVPKTLEPPNCASCHSKNSDGADGMPGLKGAYHGQCITCHQKMEVANVKPRECVKCHEAKK
jgi:hypothetical protein